MIYKAFISYSHAADGRLAPALQSALHRFAKPWYRLRAIRVFRDKTTLAATPALWPSMEQALGESEHFLLLASPEAAASEWVQREIMYWIERRPLDRGKLLIVLTGGTLLWDGKNNDFDWTSTDALPRALEKSFARSLCSWTFAGRARRSSYHCGTRIFATPSPRLRQRSMIGQRMK